MKKYKIEFTKKEVYIIDMLAKTENEAKILANKYFNDIENTYMEQFYQQGETEVEVSNVFDVSNTDDPFSPENKELLNNKTK